MESASVELKAGQRGRIVAAVLLLFGSVAAHATHEIDHRFTMHGTVTYEDGTPAAGVAVQMLGRDAKVMGQVTAGPRGDYRTVLHAHDEDAGKVLDLRAGNVIRKVKIEFDPADKQSERSARIDFVIVREAPSAPAAAPPPAR